MADYISLGTPGDVYPSCGGHGTLEILEVIKILEMANIPCCVVGISALRYFGAHRLRDSWELCVPTHKLESASAILKAEPYNQIYETWQPEAVQLYSLRHTFPRFKLKGLALWFIIIPSQDCHLDCQPSNFEWSQMGIPYLKLEIFAQSLLDTLDRVALADLVDGMDLAEEWGLAHLNLAGTNDVTWAKQKNQKIYASVPLTENSCLLELSDTPFSSEETWKRIVGTKDRRIGAELPKELCLTRFRYRNDEDPRMVKRDDA